MGDVARYNNDTYLPIYLDRGLLMDRLEQYNIDLLKCDLCGEPAVEFAYDPDTYETYWLCQRCFDAEVEVSDSDENLPPYYRPPRQT